MRFANIFKTTHPLTDEIEFEANAPETLIVHVPYPMGIVIKNTSTKPVSQIKLKYSPSAGGNLYGYKSFSTTDVIQPKSSEKVTLMIISRRLGEVDLGRVEVSLNFNGKTYEKQLLDLGKTNVVPPDTDVKVDVSNTLQSGIENPVKITFNNLSDFECSNIQFKTNFTELIKCDNPTGVIDSVPAKSSKYTAIFITPRIASEVDLGNLHTSFESNGGVVKKEPIAIGTYDIEDGITQKPAINSENITYNLSIARETEFYQGFIRFKMSVTNTSSFMVNNVALEFDFDMYSLRMDKHEPDYPIKNGKILLGNISGNTSKTIAVYFEPMICSKNADINCQINYKDAKGQPKTAHMNTKSIRVVCPIMHTDSDINIGRLKELIENLPYRDSKVYQVQGGFDAEVLKIMSHEVVQKHDVKHIRTLHTKNSKALEIWYYGKTKVNKHDIVIKISVSSETQSIELFAATQIAESLTGVLAEVGRELMSEIESKTASNGNIQQVFNVTVKDSIIQRSNLLSSCDINGNCTGDVVIEDNLVQHSNVGFNVESKNSAIQKDGIDKIFCVECGAQLHKDMKFCFACGQKVNGNTEPNSPDFRHYGV